jgi:hypothetical protein
MKASLLLALPALAVALPAHTKTTSAAPAYASIKSVAYGGTGCPQNSASIIISDGGTVLTAIFDQFLVETFGTTVLKSCQLNVDVAFPTGWSFSVAQVDQRGSADLDANVTATIDIYTYFSGQSQQVCLCRRG